MSCKAHGVVVAAVPWARHDSSFTRSFEDQVAWLTVHTSKTAVSELMRIAWRSVGWICQRVAAEAQAQHDLLSGLERIGFDEIAIRKGQRYLTVAVDHDTGKLVWAHPARNHYTHYNPKLEQKAARGAALFLLFIQLQAIIEMSLLRELGFGCRSIDAILERARRYAQIEHLKAIIATETPSTPRPRHCVTRTDLDGCRAGARSGAGWQHETCRAGRARARIDGHRPAATRIRQCLFAEVDALAASYHALHPA